MVLSGSSPGTAWGARSGRLLRCEDRAEPAGEPSDGTVDSVEGANWSIAGSDDNAVPMHHAKMLHDGIAGSKLVILPNAGHMNFIDQPDMWQGAVSSFLEQ